MKTDVNPGSNTAKHNFTFKVVLRRVWKNLLKRNWRLSIHSISVEPINYLQQNLLLFRRFKHCNICGFTGQFIHLYDALRISWNSACPKCDSRSRHRGLFYIYNEVLKEASLQTTVLHFAPEPIFHPLFKSNTSLVYKSTDYLLSDVDYPHEDIQKLSFKDQSYDLVLCNHVIEHVPNDAAAFSEIYRILKKSGKAIITIPGDFRRKKTVYFATLENNGHYRDYGLDVIAKMKIFFSSVKVVDLGEFDLVNGQSRGIRRNDLAFICIKK